MNIKEAQSTSSRLTSSSSLKFIQKRNGEGNGEGMETGNLQKYLYTRTGTHMR